MAIIRKIALQAEISSFISKMGLSALLNSTADSYSRLSGPQLIAKKVSELVVMGGEYPSGCEYNFWGDNASTTAHVFSSWTCRITFLGNEVGSKVLSGGALSTQAPETDPVRAAYRWYVGHNTSRYSWDPLTVLYACQGLGSLFSYASSFGYNYVFPSGSNEWVFDEKKTNQRWLKLRVDNVTAGRELDRLMLEGARSVG